MARISLSATGFYKTPKIHYDRTTGKGRPFFYFAYGAAVSEVTVDTLTGEYCVDRVDILHDVGESLNPAIILSQNKDEGFNSWEYPILISERIKTKEIKMYFFIIKICLN